ncbi:uncharacterized protein [Drosophila suzukii]|uniref:Peptidase aspartic putative domain-containing protein n=1 Tax=Drosophila suzukii TaxID=28584 RepID=A0ABM4TZL4_DROSZ
MNYKFHWKGSTSSGKNSSPSATKWSFLTKRKGASIQPSTNKESQENEREGNNFRQAGNPDEAAPMASGVGNENLGKIHIKLFTGDYKEWPAFKNIFESTIHSKQHLTAIQKLHYLKTYITGEAADLIRHMPITDAAYEAAWTFLIDRYNRPRHIVNSLLETFVNLPSTARAYVTVLCKVTDGATEIVRGLDAAGQTNKDCWIIHFVLAKIDAETRRKWIEGSRELESPSVDDLLKFLDRRCEEFELNKCESDIDSKVGPQHGKAKRSSHALVPMEANTCVKCNSKEHKIYACSKFDILNSQAAVTSTHSRDDERHIPSAPEDARVTISHIAQAQVAHTAESLCNGSTTATQPQGLRKSALPTALVFVRNSIRSHTTCRVLLDSGSELSYVSERCVQALGLARSPSRILVTEISSIKAETTRGCSTLDLQSRISDHTMKVRAHVLSKITSTLARHDIAASALKAFAGFELADSDYQSLAPVDILLGSDYVWTVLTGQKMFDNQGNIIAISTIFGWVITSIVTTGCSSTTTMHTAIDIDESLRRFWELEDVKQKFHGKPEDDEVEQHFVKTHTRDSKGRYIVELQFKNSKEQFSDTLQEALTRFRGVECRLKKDPNLHSQYVQFMLRALDQLTHDHQHDFPTAAKILKEQFYVDEVLA